MILERGDMWSAYDTPDHFIITTNAYITKAVKLVMGRGIAKQARDRFPGLDTRFGETINELNRGEGVNLAYGMIDDFCGRASNSSS